MRSFRVATIPGSCLFAVMLVSAIKPAHAHPMGNFSINHYARIVIHAGSISIHYIIDMAEIPTVSERASMDTNGDGKISLAEQNAYLASAAIRLSNGIALRFNGKKVVPIVMPVAIEFIPGAGGLPTTRITLDAVATSTSRHFANGATVDYIDGNYDTRTGWKEIVVTPDLGLNVKGANISQTDFSRELTVYPIDATVAPPQQTEAHFAILSTEGTGVTSSVRPGAAVGPSRKRNESLTASSPVRTDNTPRDAFTQAISRGKLTTGLVLFSLAIAFVFGALHALSPGHGKAMVAAYLVGARGTPRHAVLLGIVVTVTHTIGVFCLGLVMLFAAKYVVPERLYPALSALSGITITVIGAILLRRRWLVLTSNDAENDVEVDACTALENRAYENVSMPDPDSPALSRLAGSNVAKTSSAGPLSVRSLVTLGITGGILPCPSALVVMLSAIALHRVAFGLILIVAFSVGLAVILTAIGLCVVYMRALTERISTRGKLFQRLPVMSAAFVMLIGLYLIFKSTEGGGY